eukprot:m.2530 g.2530  ORF g.2530 m.2530 type:complete len:58 (+) comp1818_c0_seq1:220-393(+)
MNKNELIIYIHKFVTFASDETSVMVEMYNIYSLHYFPSGSRFGVEVWGVFKVEMLKK